MASRGTKGGTARGAGKGGKGGGTDCLTLHQPLASLMAYGLKRVEGRVWNTPFKGTLWIHAASKECDPEDIKRFEDFYSEVYQLELCDPSARPVFPQHYPLSCLVGRVHVHDVVPKEYFDSRRSMPAAAALEGEANGSGFFFLCERAERLVMPLPMSGQHKLWHLDPKQAAQAQRGLRAMEQMPIKFEHFIEPPSARPPLLVPAPTPAAHPSAPDRHLASPPVDLAAADEDEWMIQQAIALSLADQPFTEGSRQGRGSVRAPLHVQVPDDTSLTTPHMLGTPGSTQGEATPQQQPELDAVDVKKKRRALLKKLQQVDDLLAAEAEGKALDTDQQQKVGKRDQIQAELASLQASHAQSSSW